MKLSLADILNGDELTEIVSSTVKNALRDVNSSSEAQREKLLQKSLEDDLDKTVHKGKQKKEVEQELDKNPLAGAPKRAPEIGQPEGNPQQPPQAQAQASALIDVDAAIEKFDRIRSGRSFKDPDVRDAFKQFFATLQPDQQQAFIMGLDKTSKIINPTVDSSGLKAPPEPQGNVDARLQMLNQRKADLKSQAAVPAQAPQASIAPQTPQAAPQRAPAPAPERRRHKKSGEDTSPPIRVGQRTSENVQREMRSSLVD